MSLSAAQIFLRTDDLAGVEQVVAEALVEWQGLVPLDLDERGLTPPPERRVVLLPPVEGWITVIEESRKLDRSLARNLRARLGVLTIAAELDGHFLAADLEVIDAEGETETWTVPDTGGDDERMPIYEDAEAGFWTRLRGLGVPAGLIAVEWEEVVDTLSPVAEGARISAEAGAEGLDKTMLPIGNIVEAEVVDGPRVRPDLWVAGPDGEAQVIEARRLTGEWNATAATALARIEQAQLGRILGTLAWTTDDPVLPRVVFTYEGVEDETFALVLEMARREHPALLRARDVPWLSIRGLADAVRERVRDDDAWEVGRRCGLRLELRHAEWPNWSFLLDLRSLWRGYLEAPDALEAVIDVSLVQLLATGRERPSIDETRLFPLLLGEGAPGIAALATRPFADGVWVAIGFDTGQAVRPLTRQELASVGLGFDDALDLAVRRLDRATEEHDEFAIYEQAEGVTLSGEFPDVSSAARILSSAVLSHVAQQLGDGCFVAIPARDIFLAAEGTDHARRWLDGEVARRVAESNLPLSSMVWSVENGELVEAGRAKR